MKLIETKTLGTAAASITFTSIPQTFTDLVLVFSTRNTATTVSGRFYINGDTTMTNYESRILYGAGSGAGASLSGATSGEHNGLPGWMSEQDTLTANTFGSTSMYFPNYQAATFKSISVDSVNETNATQAFQGLTSSLWKNTSAITSIEILAALTGNFVIGSQASLYGILKGSDGIVTTS
jgi:hypothetical protein